MKAKSRTSRKASKKSLDCRKSVPVEREKFVSLDCGNRIWRVHIWRLEDRTHRVARSTSLLDSTNRNSRVVSSGILIITVSLYLQKHCLQHLRCGVITAMWCYQIAILYIYIIFTSNHVFQIICLHCHETLCTASQVRMCACCYAPTLPNVRLLKLLP